MEKFENVNFDFYSIEKIRTHCTIWGNTWTWPSDSKGVNTSH
jgi:hypothetical protein